MEWKPNRLEGYNYAYNGWYFITQCVDKFKCVLGNVPDSTTLLSEIGKIVKEKITWMQKQYTYMKIDEYVIMPNHIHFILTVDKPVGDARERPLQKYKSVSGLMGAFKTVSSKEIHNSGFKDFKWQRSFWDHIIRTEESYLRIKEYIINNPIKWALDVENTSVKSRNMQKYYQDITGYIPPEKKDL